MNAVARTTLGLGAALVLALLLAVAVAAPAGAHAALVSTDPQDGATVEQALPAITLTFSEPVSSLAVEVVGGDGQDVADGDTADGSETVEQALAPLTAGHYTVSFRVASDDGHPVQGSFTFTYAGPGPEPAEEPAVDGGSTDSADSAAEPASDDELDEAEPASKDDGGVPTGVLALGLAVVVFVTIGGLALRRGRGVSGGA